MKYPRVAPLAGLVAAAMILAACGGGSDNNNTPAPTPPGTGNNTPGGTPTPPAAGTDANSVAMIKQAMSGTHEGASPELPAVNRLSAGPFKVATAPADAKALGGYGHIFTSADNTATNTRIHLRNFETYVRSAGKWNRVQFSGKVKGKTYAANYVGAGQDCTLANGCLRAEDDGGVSFKPVAGRFLHFWPEAAFTQSLITPAQVEAIFTTVQTRLVKDGAGPDDRANAKYLANVGALWIGDKWAATDYVRDAYPAIADLKDAGNGRLTFVKNDFAASSFHSGTDAQADELATAVAGGRAPIANSQITKDDDDVVRIIFIGDSITQGNVEQLDGAGKVVGTAQDSFRRNLWNSIITDASFPQVDFVGTRLGTATSDQNYCATRTTAPDTGTYKLPEFDADHQGYWGACVDQVNELLTPALATLDSDAVRSEPDVAVIHIGTNNLNTQGEAGVAAAINQLQAMINNLRQTNDDISILVAKVIPFRKDGALSPLVASYNAAIDAQIATMSTDKSKVVVVDHAAFPEAQLRDDFHPNDAGEKTIADVWFKALKDNNLLVDKD